VNKDEYKILIETLALHIRVISNELQQISKIFQPHRASRGLSVTLKFLLGFWEAHSDREVLIWVLVKYGAGLIQTMAKKRPIRRGLATYRKQQMMTNRLLVLRVVFVDYQQLNCLFAMLVNVISSCNAHANAEYWNALSARPPRSIGTKRKADRIKTDVYETRIVIGHLWIGHQSPALQRLFIQSLPVLLFITRPRLEPADGYCFIYVVLSVRGSAVPWVRPPKWPGPTYFKLGS